MKKLTYIPLIIGLLLTLVGCSQQGSSLGASDNQMNTSTEETQRKLTTPELIYTYGNVDWAKDDLASMYQISVNNELSFVTNNNISLTTYGTYEIKVRSIAENTDRNINSDWSTVLKVNYEEKIAGNIILDYSSITMVMDDYYNLNASVYPVDSNVKITYTSSDESIAYCDSTGFVVANKVGEVEITATAKGYVAAKCYVKVNPSLSLSAGETITIDEGDSIDLGIECKPTLTSSDIISFKCSDSSIAFVGDTGVLTGLKEGTCKVEVICSNGTKASVNVVVNKLLPSIVTFTVKIAANAFTNYTEIPTDYNVYLVGSFNNWKTCDSTYKMTRLENGQFTYTDASFPPKSGISYKYILQTADGYAWEAYNGDNLANRTHTITPGNQSVNDTITLWQTLSVAA